MASYLADGFTARSGRSDVAKRRRIPVELVDLIEGMALRRPPPKIAHIHREAVRIAEERGWPAPSYPVVYRIIAGLDRGLVSMAHKGDVLYRNDFDLVLRRESANANDLWQVDHTQLDVMVLDESDQPVRPWLAVILDCCHLSDYLAAFVPTIWPFCSDYLAQSRPSCRVRPGQGMACIEPAERTIEWWAG